MKYKVGAEPVYLEQVPVADINGAMVNRLNNRGHFEAHEQLRSDRKGRAHQWYSPYRPAHHIPLRDPAMGDRSYRCTGQCAWSVQRSRCAISIGEPYDLTRLTEERARVSDRMRDHGWYKLRADDLLWTADTTLGDQACCSTYA